MLYLHVIGSSKLFVTIFTLVRLDPVMCPENITVRIITRGTKSFSRDVDIESVGT